jgi:hypothetical protein
MSTVAPPLAPDLEFGLRRLKLATIRAQAPEVLQTARTQRWAPEEVLRTLVMAEIAARDRTNQRLRLKTANLPVLKTLDDFPVCARVCHGHVLVPFACALAPRWARVTHGFFAFGGKNGRQNSAPSLER